MAKGSKTKLLLLFAAGAAFLFLVSYMALG